jgi:hypothetical protein
VIGLSWGLVSFLVSVRQVFSGSRTDISPEVP